MENLRYVVAKKAQIHTHNQLFSPEALFAFLLAIIAALVYLFPGKALVNSLINQSYISSVDFHYSLLLLPDTATSSIKFSDIDKNPGVVLQKLNDVVLKFKAGQNVEGLWFNYIILKSMAFNPKLSKVLKQQANQIMVEYFNIFKQLPESEQQLHQLGEDALAINDTKQSLVFYEQIIAYDAQQTIYFYGRVAQIALWAKECVKSANYDFTAQHLATKLEDQRYFYFTALKTLFQCDQSTLAVTLAQQNLDGLSEDIQTYQLLIDLTIKSDKAALAQQYLLKLLELKSKQKNK